MKQRTKATRVFRYQKSRHVFNVDCGFNHMSLIWPDRKFNGEANDSCWKLIELLPLSYGSFY